MTIDAFCERHAVTEAERAELIRYLAYMRMRRTLALIANTQQGST